MANYIQLKEDKFRNLIHDVYAMYAPKHINKVDKLVEDYKSSALGQMNAIKTVYIIYNKPGHPNYDENMVGTENNMIKLMESYAMGERLLSQETIEEEKRRQEELRIASEEEGKRRQEEERKRREEENRKLAEAEEEEKKKLLELSGSQIEEFRKMKEEVEEHKRAVLEYKKLLEDQRKMQLEAEPKISVFENMDIEIMGDTDNVKLPDNKFLATLCIGQRIIATDSSEEGVVGLEVLNMHDDYVTNPKKPQRIIEFKKV